MKVDIKDMPLFNSIIHRALTTAKIPSWLQPASLSRSNGKRPDGAAMVLWARGRGICHIHWPHHIIVRIQVQLVVASAAEGEKGLQVCGNFIARIYSYNF